MSARPVLTDWLKSAPAKPVLDASFLDRLAQHLKPPILNELMSDGLIGLADRIQRLGELADAGDHEGLARLGHDLVGMAGNLGLTRFSSASAELSRLAREGRPEALDMARALQDTGHEAEAAMRAYMRGEWTG